MIKDAKASSAADADAPGCVTSWVIFWYLSFDVSGAGRLVDLHKQYGFKFVVISTTRHHVMLRMQNKYRTLSVAPLL